MTKLAQKKEVISPENSNNSILDILMSTDHSEDLSLVLLHETALLFSS